MYLPETDKNSRISLKYLSSYKSDVCKVLKSSTLFCCYAPLLQSVGIISQPLQCHDSKPNADGIALVALGAYVHVSSVHEARE